MSIVELKKNPTPTPCCRFSMTTYTNRHLHAHIEICYIIKGEFLYNIDGKEYQLEPGDMTMIYPFTTHKFSSLTDDCERFVLQIKEDDFGPFGDTLRQYRPNDCVFHSELLDSIAPEREDQMRYISWAFNSRGALRRLSAYKAMISLFYTLLETAGIEKKQDAFMSPLLQRALAVCQSEFVNADFNAETIAKSLYCSRSHIEQLFLKSIHISIKKYITQLRIELAETYLRDTQLPIAAIAREVGFGSVRTFNRTFYENSHMTPLEWRKIHNK